MFLLKEKLGKETFDNILDNDITTQEISAAIKSLKDGKSTSPDMISNEMLKYGGPIILKPLEKLVLFPSLRDLIAALISCVVISLSKMLSNVSFPSFSFNN
jgi:accessory gene regulator protein AgrB